jgi:ribosome recycling factor
MTDDVLKTTEDDMAATVEAFRRDLSHVRTGRASTALLDGLQVEYYGAMVPLNQVGSVAAPDATLLVIQVYDKGAVASIEKAVRTSDLGFNPQSDGSVIRVPIPPLTEERRRELVKHCRKMAEDFRVSMRNHRRDAIELLKGLEKDKEIAEDARRHAADKIEGLTKDYVGRLDGLLKDKEQDIMAV